MIAPDLDRIENIEDVLGTLSIALKENRANGNTTLMLDGVRSFDWPCIVIARTRLIAEMFCEDNQNARPVGAKNILKSIRGTKDPIAIDHWALGQIMQEAASEIHRLKRELRDG